MWRILTPSQKQQRLECSHAFSNLCNEEKAGVLTRIAAGDETSLYAVA